MFYAANVGAAAIAAAIILIPGAPLLSIALNANVLATALLPVTLVFMIMLANDRELMGRWVNTATLQHAGDRDRRVHLALRRRLRDRFVPAGRPPCLSRMTDHDHELMSYLEPAQLVVGDLSPGRRGRHLSTARRRCPLGAAGVRDRVSLMVIYTFVTQVG